MMRFVLLFYIYDKDIKAFNKMRKNEMCMLKSKQTRCNDQIQYNWNKDKLLYTHYCPCYFEQ